jgi:TolB protein
MRHSDTHMKFIFLMSLFCVLTACQNTSSVAYRPEGNSFRDLRQHTFGEERKEEMFSVSVSPDGEQIAFVKFRDGGKSGSDIFLKPVDARSQTQKTTHTGWDAFPEISPDGTKIAFASNRNGSWDIFVTNTGSGRAKRQVTTSSEDEIAPTWSRDSKKIAFSKYSTSAKHWEVWIYELDTGALTSLVPGLFPDYSPTQDLIVFQRASPGSAHDSIWTIDERGTIETEIYSSTDESCITPTWSPNGERLVFAAGGKRLVSSQTRARRKGVSKSSKRPTSQKTKALINFKGFDIWTVDVDGTNLNQLTSNEGQDWNPDWSSDGRIYFSSSRVDGGANIWSVIPEFVEF